MANTNKKFIDWSYGARAEQTKKIQRGEEINMDKFFLNTTCHNPALVSNGPAGLNASIKGIGWVPKKEYLPEVLEIFKKHIATWDPKDVKGYQDRGLKILVDNLYSDEAKERMDFDRFVSIEMAMHYNASTPERQHLVAHSYVNYMYNSQATAIFYQPPVVTYEVRGKMYVHGYKDMKEEEMDIYQQFVNAQHDMYHSPNTARWVKRPVYEFVIEEIFDNSTPKDAFGNKVYSLLDPITLYRV